MTKVILERTFDPPLTDAEMEEQNARLTPCLERHRGRWIQSHLSRDRTRMMCVFEAPDAESVRMALRRARVAYERVWPAEDVFPGDADTPGDGPPEAGAAERR